MPVFNGVRTIERAVASVRRQAFANWELIAIDDGSSDGSGRILARLACEEDRIQIISNEINSGASAARNRGLRSASGDVITYLDCDDEYYEGFFGLVDRFSDRADVLVFGYDYVNDDAEGSPVSTWDPTPYRGLLFSRNLMTPLGVAHRRTLLADKEAFDENLWISEDWDLWKRMARAGSEFLYLPFRSGLYHIRADSLTRAPRITRRQEATYQSRWQAGETLYPSSEVCIPHSAIQRVAFASPYSCISRGANLPAAGMYLLWLLRSEGIDGQAFGTTYLDGTAWVEIEDVQAGLGLPHRTERAVLPPFFADVNYSVYQTIPVTTLKRHLAQTGTATEEYLDFIIAAFFKQFVGNYRPDCVVTHGDGELSKSYVNIAKYYDIPVVILLDEPGARPLDILNGADYLVTFSESKRDLFWKQHQVACHALPIPEQHLSPERGRPDARIRQILDFFRGIRRQSGPSFTPS